MFVCAPVSRGQRKAMSLVPQEPPTLVFWDGILFAPAKPRGSTCLCLPSAGISVCQPCLALPVGVRVRTWLPVQPALCCINPLPLLPNPSKFLTVYVLRNGYFQSPCVSAPCRRRRDVCVHVSIAKLVLGRQRGLCSFPHEASCRNIRRSPADIPNEMKLLLASTWCVPAQKSMGILSGSLIHYVFCLLIFKAVNHGFGNQFYRAEFL